MATLEEIKVFLHEEALRYGRAGLSAENSEENPDYYYGVEYGLESALDTLERLES